MRKWVFSMLVRNDLECWLNISGKPENWSPHQSQIETFYSRVSQIWRHFREPESILSSSCRYLYYTLLSQFKIFDFMVDFRVIVFSKHFFSHLLASQSEFWGCLIWFVCLFVSYLLSSKHAFVLEKNSVLWFLKYPFLLQYKCSFQWWLFVFPLRAVFMAVRWGN